MKIPLKTRKKSPKYTKKRENDSKNTQNQQKQGKNKHTDQRYRLFLTLSECGCKWVGLVGCGWVGVFLNNDFPEKTDFSNDFMLKSAQK